MSRLTAGGGFRVTYMSDLACTQQLLCCLCCWGMELALSGRLEIETCPIEPRKGLQSYLISAEEERRKPELACGGQLTEHVPLKTVCRLNCNIPPDGWIPGCPWGPDHCAAPAGHEHSDSFLQEQRGIPLRSQPPCFSIVYLRSQLYLSLFFPELELVFFSRRMKMVIMWRQSKLETCFRVFGE